MVKMKKFKKILFTIILLLSIFLLSNKVNSTDQNSDDKVHFISVGPGDAILVESNGNYGLVDTGNPSNNDNTELFQSEYFNQEKFGGKKVKDYLIGLGVKRLDFILMTHVHSDHIGGIPDLEGFIDKDTVIIYKEFINKNIPFETECKSQGYFDQSMNFVKKGLLFDISLKEDFLNHIIDKINNSSLEIKEISFNKKDTTITNVDDSIYFKFGDFNVKLYNIHDITTTETNSDNNNSIVALLEKGTQKIVLTGDLGSLMDSNTGDDSKGISCQVADEIGDITILKAGHHGNVECNTLYELKKYKPECFIVSNDGDEIGKRFVSSFEVPYYLLKNQYQYLGMEKEAQIYITTNTSSNNYNGAIVTELEDDSFNVYSYSENAQEKKIADEYVMDFKNRMASGYHRNWYNGYDKASPNERIRIFFDTDNNRFITGWKQYAGAWYFFDENGLSQNGWKQLADSKWYYFENNAMATGKKIIDFNGKVFCYYFCENGQDPQGYRIGEMLNNITYKGNTYAAGGYLMSTGWQELTINGITSWYYFNNDYTIQTGWKAIDGEWFYFSEEPETLGQMQTGEQVLEFNGIIAKYFFCEQGGTPEGYIKGQMLRGITYNGYTYGAGGRANIVGWQYIKSRWYYFNNDNIAQTGWQLIDVENGGKAAYYFDKKGIYAEYDNNGKLVYGEYKDRKEPRIIDVIKTEKNQDEVTVEILAVDDGIGLADNAYSFDGGYSYSTQNVADIPKSQDNVIIKVKDKVGYVKTIEESLKKESTTSVKIMGDNIYGSKLTAQVTTDGDGEKEYQWYKEGISEENKIVGATNNEYIVGEGLIGKKIYVVVTVKDGTDYKGSTANDETDRANNGTEEVETKKIIMQEVETYLVYTGQEQTGVASGTGYTVTNGTKIDAGSYTATAKLSDKTNTVWADTNNTSDKSLNWSIAKKQVAVTWNSANSFVYNGNNQGPTLTNTQVNGVNGEKLNLEVTGQKKNIGTDYTATASISSVTGRQGKKENYELTGNTKEFSIMQQEKRSVAELNGNHIVDMGDLLLLLRHIAQSNSEIVLKKHPQWKLDDQNVIIGDINKNGKIDTGDVLKVRRYLAANSNKRISDKHPDWLSLE